MSTEPIEPFPQRYLNALVAHVAADPNGVEIVGEVAADGASHPHTAVFLEIGPGAFLGTTAGLSVRSAPLAVAEGLQSFELCALTSGHAPAVLKFLSEIALFILGSLAKPDAKPFRHYEIVQVGDEERVILTPRWKLLVDDASLELIEPLPLSPADWDRLGPMSLEDRATWVRKLGPSSPDRWKALFPKL